MRRTPLAQIAIVMVVWLSVAAYAQDRPSLCGLELAYPQTMPILTPGDSSLMRNEDQWVQVMLTVDSSGKVTAVNTGQVISVEYLAQIDKFMRTAVFHPGFLNGVARDQKIPATVYLFADHRPPLVSLPLDSAGHLADPDVFVQACRENGVKFASIKRFPPYHCTIDPRDTMPVPRFLLASLNLNKTGTPTRIDLVRNTYSAFAAQLISAINWGKYVPTKIDSTSVAGRGFIAVFFYPTLVYPTTPFKNPPNDTLPAIQKLAVRLLPDTLGLMSKPVPRFVPHSEYQLKAQYGLWSVEGIFRYRIDTAGVAALLSGGNGSAKAIKFGEDLATRMRFYPAMDFAGKPVPFEGAVRVRPAGESNVRVEFLWLEQR